MLYDVNDDFYHNKKNLIESLIVCGLDLSNLDNYLLSDYFDARRIPDDIRPITDDEYKTFYENLQIDNYDFVFSKIKRNFVNYFFTKNLIDNS